MQMPSAPVTLTVEQLTQLNDYLTRTRHDINNHLTVILSAAEVIRHRPAMAERMMENVLEKAQRIKEDVLGFSQEFEKTFGITRP